MRFSIPTQGLAGLEEPAQALVLEHERTAYDAAYSALAPREGLLITGDKRLYNVVNGELLWIRWIGDYESIVEKDSEVKKG